MHALYLNIGSDMGLGKTLQTICIVAGDHHSKATAYKVLNPQRGDVSLKFFVAFVPAYDQFFCTLGHLQKAGLFQLPCQHQVQRYIYFIVFSLGNWKQ